MRDLLSSEFGSTLALKSPVYKGVILSWRRVLGTQLSMMGNMILLAHVGTGVTLPVLVVD